MKNMEMPLISVIIPVYNVEKYLPRCVQSVLSQTYENLEILLVDDGSPDGCPGLCDQYARQDPRVSVLHKQNAGQALARNAALDLCRGDYIAFVDSDDFLEPDTYEAMLELAVRSRAGIVCCGRYNVSEETGLKTPGLCPEKEEILDPEEMMRRMFTWRNCDCSPCDKLFKRSVFDSLRFPPKSGFEDIGILYKLVLAAKTIALLPRPCYNYLQRAGSTSYGMVTDRTFQYPMYAEMVYEDVKRICPAATREARFLLVRALNRPLILLDQSEAPVRKSYAQELRKGRKALRRHMLFFLFGPYFGLRERITDLLLSLGLYRAVFLKRHGGERTHSS